MVRNGPDGKRRATARTTKHLRYSEHIDFLVPSIIYLGTHTYYWARSPQAMASELSLDHEHLRLVFEGFPAIYRRSHRLAPNHEPFYALQARYAQREGGDTQEPEQVSNIAPLDKDKLQVIITFVVQMAEAERAGFRAWITGGIAILAAVVSAIAAIAAAFLAHSGT
jgi:hypothetical protein